MYSEKSVCFYAFRVDRTEKSIEVLSELKGGGGQGTHTLLPFFKYGSTPIPGKPGVDRSR